MACGAASRAVVLRVREAEVYGLDIVAPDSVRAQWLTQIGGHYIDGRQVAPIQVDDLLGPMDLILEATGVAALAFNLMDALAYDGVYVLTGIPGGDRPLQISGAELIREVVLNNQVMFGSVPQTLDGLPGLTHPTRLFSWSVMIQGPGVLP